MLVDSRGLTLFIWTPHVYFRTRRYRPRCDFLLHECPGHHLINFQWRQADATEGLAYLMSLLPDTTTFFVNCWTWGYEEVLKCISRTFKSKACGPFFPVLTLDLISIPIQIHVDRYKHSIYSRLSDPFMRSIITDDPAATRYHACERFDRCEYAADPVEGEKDARKVVYVNPVTMGAVKWAQYLAETEELLLQGKEVSCLVSPL